MREDIPHPLFKETKYNHNAPFQEKVICNSFSVFREIFEKH